MGILDAFDKSFGADGSFNLGASTQQTPQGNSTKNSMRQALLAARAKQRESLPEGVEYDEEYEDDFSSSPLGRYGFTQGKPVAGGFSLRYDQDTPIRGIDVGGPNQEERLADFVSKEIDNNSHGIDVGKAMETLELNSPRDILPGLEVRLLGHQAIGVAWMLSMEKDNKYKGGILADDMGLGKTVQMIALMSKNMPDAKEECKTTLIVVPAALMQQWKEEVETKTNGLFGVHIHHGRDKLKKVSQVRRKDVVITSYQTLCTDFSTPHYVSPDEEAEWVASNGGVLAQTKFYRVIADEAQFIRNRSTRSSISMAMVRAKYRWMLTGTPITNTLADLYGLLRFGRFQPWNDWNSFNEHIAKVQVEDAPLAGSRAQAILQPILLRRTKNSMLDGKPILDLPPKEIEMVQLQFSKEERDVYDSFEKRTKIRLNKFIHERTLLKNHAQVLVMILRLRQLCCHPHLILSQTSGYEDPTLLVGSDNDKEIGRARKSMGHVWVNKTKQEFLARAAASEILDFSDDADASAPYCPVCKEAYSNNNGHVLVCGHEMCFDCILDVRNAPFTHDGVFGEGTEKEYAAAEKAFEEAEAKGHRPCPTCKKMIDMGSEKIYKSAAFEPTDEELSNYARSKRRTQSQSWKRSGSPKLPSRSPSPSGSAIELSDSDEDLPDIMSVFQKVAPSKNYSKGKRRVISSDDDSMGEGTSTKSRSGKKASAHDGDSDVEYIGMSPSKRIAGKRKAGDDDSDIELIGVSPSRRDRKKARETPPRKNNSSDGPSDAVLATWSRGDDDMAPSTKMKALVQFLKEWDASGDKVICYSQWTSMLDLLEILLSRHGMRSLRFDGKMDRKSRDETLSTFKQPGGPKIMLISTKCGSVGLNLVSANRVVNMDLSWNYAAESQAYDRCHRIGQDKSVFVKRLVVENTIEERMLKLQDVKVGLAEAALGEGTGAKLHKLSVKDIKYLFGMAPAMKDGPSNGRASSPDSESSP